MPRARKAPRQTRLPDLLARQSSLLSFCRCFPSAGVSSPPGIGGVLSLNGSFHGPLAAVEVGLRTMTIPVR